MTSRQPRDTVPEWRYDPETKTYTRSDTPRGVSVTRRELNWLRWIRWKVRNRLIGGRDDGN